MMIINEGENHFSISPSQQVFNESNSYLRPFKIEVYLDEDVQEYQYSIKDLISKEILISGWFEASDKTEAIKAALGQIANFVQNQAQIFNNMLSDIIDFRYDIINNKFEEE
jgi:DNA-directed RNA polymerase subunit L